MTKPVIQYQHSGERRSVAVFGLLSISLGCIGVSLIAPAVVQLIHPIYSMRYLGWILLCAVFGLFAAIVGAICAGKGMSRNRPTVGLSIGGLILSAAAIMAFAIVVCLFFSKVRLG